MSAFHTLPKAELLVFESSISRSHFSDCALHKQGSSQVTTDFTDFEDSLVIIMAHQKLLRPATRFFVLALAHMASLFINLPASVEAQPSGTVSETQLVQQLQPFPDYSKFVQLLQVANLTAVLGPGESLYNKTVGVLPSALLGSCVHLSW